MTTIATNVTTAGNIYTSETWPATPIGLSQPSATNATAAGATAITRIGIETVALVTDNTTVIGSETNDGTTITNTSVYAGVSLPANAQVGDLVVVKSVGGSSPPNEFIVWVPVGHYLGATLNGNGGPTRYQMVSSGVWYTI
jgi:hypothetical protein